MGKKKDQIITEEHHRRPRSLGGVTNQTNISYVIPDQHRSWHTLFGNMNAYQICDQINQSSYKPENLIVTCKFINGIEVKLTGGNHSRKINKVFYAWDSLFKNLEFTEIIKYINNVWLDSSYRFYIEKVS